MAKKASALPAIINSWRLERLFWTLQDRLVKAMRLEGVGSLEEANKYLTERFMPMWNKRFSKEALSPLDVNRTLESCDLRSVFIIHEDKGVTTDYSFSLKWQRCQIARCSMTGGMRGNKVATEKGLDGKVGARFRVNTWIFN